MDFNNIQIDHPVEIEVSLNDKQTTLISSIEHKVGQSLLLTPIKHNDKTVGFPKDCIVKLYYISEGKVYRWSNVQIKAVKYNENIYHSIELNVEAEVLNRRGAYRVYIGEQVPLVSFTAKGPKKTTVLLKDVSETGVAFLSNEEYELNRIVRLVLQFSENKQLPITAQIVRVQDLDNKTDKLYGCKFIEKVPQLTNFLMKRQQEHQRNKMR